jgi:hypothetical protein
MNSASGFLIYTNHNKTFCFRRHCDFPSQPSTKTRPFKLLLLQRCYCTDDYSDVVALELILSTTITVAALLLRCLLWVFVALALCSIAASGLAPGPVLCCGYVDKWTDIPLFVFQKGADGKRAVDPLSSTNRELATAVLSWFRLRGSAQYARVVEADKGGGGGQVVSFDHISCRDGDEGVNRKLNRKGCHVPSLPPKLTQ